MKRVDVIIVNWNTGPRLRACLAALAQSRRAGYRLGRVVVIDNASTDQSMAHLAPGNLPLTVIKNEVNLGFAAACNQAAAGSTAEYLLFLNPDTRVLGNTLAASVQWMEDPRHAQTGILGVQLLDEDGHVTRTCARFPATRYFVHRMLGLNYVFPEACPELLYTEWDHLDSRQVDHVPGAYFFIRQRIFHELGGFDQQLFLYFEDVDLSFRTSRAGWGSYYLASVQCYHTGYGSSSQGEAWRLFHCLRSRLFYASKHLGVRDATMLLLATAFIEPFSRVGHALATGSVRQLQAVALAYYLLWRALPGIVTKQSCRVHPPAVTRRKVARAAGE